VEGRDDSSLVVAHVSVVHVTRGWMILVILAGKRVPKTKVVSVVKRKKRDWRGGDGVK